MAGMAELPYGMDEVDGTGKTRYKDKDLKQRNRIHSWTPPFSYIFLVVLDCLVQNIFFKNIKLTLN